MIDVLLATYRPEPTWLDAQVKSVLAQKDVDVNLIKREDDSGLGASANFNELLRLSKSDYAAFCDQDDIWEEDKLRRQMGEMEQMEATFGENIPMLVFCDSLVVDSEMHSLGGTNLGNLGVDAKTGVAVNRLAMQNFIPGHSMLINAALRKLVGEIPSEAVMYDYWVALIAAAFGRIGFVKEPLVRYRQHQGNSLGQGRRSSGAVEFRRRLAANVKQAKAFVNRFGMKTPVPIVALARFDGMSWLGRRRAIVGNGLYKQGFVRNLILFALA